MGFSSEFWAAIAGAIVGGAISALLQILSGRAAAREKKVESQRARLALLRTYLFKVIKIDSDFIKFKQHLDECAAKAAKGGSVFGWSTLIPLATLPRPVNFTPEEMGALISLRDEELFNDLLAFDDVHAGAVDVLELYRSERMKLSDQLPAEMKGLTGTITLTKEQYLKVAPKTAQLDQLAKDIFEYVAKTAVPPFALSHRLTAAINKEFKLSLRIEQKSADDVTEQAAVNRE